MELSSDSDGERQPLLSPSNYSDSVGEDGYIKNMRSAAAAPEMPELSSTQHSSTTTRIMVHLKGFRINPRLSSIISDSLAPLIVWGVSLLICGEDALPGGSVFLLVLLEFGGRVLGYLVSLIHVPPMVGMLGLGIAANNIDALDLMRGWNWNPDLSAPVRQIALAVILTRAGFGLDLNTLLKFKWLVLRLAVLPTVVEALSVGLVTHFILDFPLMWGLLVGFVVAAVSPAVIVPRILELKSQGYGEKKGVPTIVLASASLDNVVAISLFGVALGFIFSSKGTLEMVFQFPIEVVAGCGFGLAWGLFTAFIFNPSGATLDANESMVKGVFILGGGIISIFGFKLLNYSGAGALGCIAAAFVTISVWRRREFQEQEINQIKWGLTFLWKLFEPLLFGVIGCQIVIADLEGRTVLLSIACLVIGAIVRFGMTYATVCSTGLNIKEKLFISMAWIPKATVQAAIGPMALDYVNDMAPTSSDKTQFEQLATQVLTIAVVVILLTAPIGEFAVMVGGARLLSKDDERKETRSPETATTDHEGMP